jgi:hypothetical protein
VARAIVQAAAGLRGWSSVRNGRSDEPSCDTTCSTDSTNWVWVENVENGR